MTMNRNKRLFVCESIAHKLINEDEECVSDTLGIKITIL